MNIQSKIPSTAKKICNTLHKKGFEAYICGGAIRDIIIGREPKDFDIVSNATPEDIEKLFPKTLPIGKAFGIITVIYNNESYEIAQMRIDGNYSDGRHPDDIFITRDIEKDLARRDFTMNAIAWCPSREIIRDPYAGTMDIMDKEITFVGDALIRIQEDKLRILRAFRFSSQIGFKIADSSLEAIQLWINEGNTFEGVSQERISAEFSKIVTGKNAMETIKLMAEIGLLWMIIPELKDLCEEHNNEYHTEFMRDLKNISNTSILVHVLYVIKFATEHLLNRGVETETEKLLIMLAALFHDIGKPVCRETKSNGKSRYLNHDTIGAEMTFNILTRMKFSNEIIKGVTNLVRRHMNAHDIPKIKKVHKIKRILASEYFDLLMILSYCDTMGTAGNNGVPNLKDAEAFHNCVCDYISKYGKKLPTPLVTGDTLIHLGFTPGPDFKERLEKTFNYQLNGCDCKIKLISYAKGLILKNQSWETP